MDGTIVFSESQRGNGTARKGLRGIMEMRRGMPG